MKQNRPWGRQRTTIAVLAGMVLISAGASAAVHRGNLPAALRLGYGWFFHIAFAVFIFGVVYALVALLTATVRSGGPPSKMTGLGFSWEWEKAVELANSGVASLEELNNRVSGLQEQVETLVTTGRETQEALVRIADAFPEVSDEIKPDARARAERLGWLLTRDQVGAQSAANAIAAFRLNLADLERLHHEMTGT